MEFQIAKHMSHWRFGMCELRKHFQPSQVVAHLGNESPPGTPLSLALLVFENLALIFKSFRKCPPRRKQR